jgi:hypothetical protein
MDDEALILAKNSALAAKTSLSGWMSGLVKEKTAVQANKGWPADFWAMAGAWRDLDFPDTAAMRANETPQTPRESF